MTMYSLLFPTVFSSRHCRKVSETYLSLEKPETLGTFLTVPSDRDDQII